MSSRNQPVNQIRLTESTVSSFSNAIQNTFFGSRVKFERETSNSVCLAAIGIRREKFVWRFFTMEKKIEQRVCLKFCVSKGITATESLKTLQKCYGESTLSRTQVFE